MSARRARPGLVVAIVGVLVASLATGSGRTAASAPPDGGAAATRTPASIAASIAATFEAATFGAGASVSGFAVRLAAPADVVSINRLGPLLASEIAALESLTARLAVPSQRGRSFNIGMTAVRRGDALVQLASGTSGRWQFPMAVTALPVEALGVVMSRRVSAVTAAGQVVLGSTSAALRGAQAGDVLDLVAVSGATVSVVLGAVVPDDEIGGAELVMSTDVADLLGATNVTRMVLFGQFDRDRLIGELAANGFVDGVGVRITRSWGPPNPDGLLGSSQVKVQLGEFDYRINTDDSLSVDPEWVAANVPPNRVTYSPIAIRAACHRRIDSDLRAALAEVDAVGLAGAIDLVDTNTNGGCFSPRYARVSQSTGSVSRHAWAMAIDINIATNGQGRVPRMDCRIVRIFRKHGFAWGGNFLVPDGMHFEWVGEPRHTLQYPSKYCPNDPVVAAAGSGPGGVDASARSTMFSEDGLPAGDGSDR